MTQHRNLRRQNKINLRNHLWTIGRQMKRMDNAKIQIKIETSTYT